MDTWLGERIVSLRLYVHPCGIVETASVGRDLVVAGGCHSLWGMEGFHIRIVRVLMFHRDAAVIVWHCCRAKWWRLPNSTIWPLDVLI